MQNGTKNGANGAAAAAARSNGINKVQPIDPDIDRKGGAKLDPEKLEPQFDTPRMPVVFVLGENFV